MLFIHGLGEDKLVYDRNSYAVSLLSVIFGLCFIRQHLMACKTKLSRWFKRLGLEVSNVWLAACGIIVKLYAKTSSLYSKTIPPKKCQVRFPPSSGDFTRCNLAQRNNLQRWHKSLKLSFCLLFAVWQKTSIKTFPVIGHRGLLCQTEGLLQWKMVWERAYVCCWTELDYVLTSALWDLLRVCCFNLFSSHFYFFLFFKTYHRILYPFSVTVIL